MAEAPGSHELLGERGVEDRPRVQGGEPIRDARRGYDIQAVGVGRDDIERRSPDCLV